MTQIARDITDVDADFLRGSRYLILDRNAKYSERFREMLVHEGIYVIRLPPRSPNLNAFAERLVRPIKKECLNRMIFFGQASPREQLHNTWLTTTASEITKDLKTGCCVRYQFPRSLNTQLDGESSSVER